MSHCEPFSGGHSKTEWTTKVPILTLVGHCARVCLLCHFHNFLFNCTLVCTHLITYWVADSPTPTQYMWVSPDSLLLFVWESGSGRLHKSRAVYVHIPLKSSALDHCDFCCLACSPGRVYHSLTYSRRVSGPSSRYGSPKSAKAVVEKVRKSAVLQRWWG